jgi:hypothetical protein
MIVPYTSCLAGNKLVPSLTKNTTSLTVNPELACLPAVVVLVGVGDDVDCDGKTPLRRGVRDGASWVMDPTVILT